MTKWLLGISLATLAAPAFAQQGYQSPYGLGVPGYPATPSLGSFMPNVYNRTQQPLSPYLNLLRGGNPAVNYFQGVRPQQMAAAQGNGMGSYPIGAASPLRTGFLPAAANPTAEPIELPAAGQPILSLSPSGHAVSFGRGTMPGGGTSAAGRPGVLGNRPAAQTQNRP